MLHHISGCHGSFIRFRQQHRVLAKMSPALCRSAATAVAAAFADAAFAATSFAAATRAGRLFQDVDSLSWRRCRVLRPVPRLPRRCTSREPSRPCQMAWADRVASLLYGQSGTVPGSRPGDEDHPHRLRRRRLHRCAASFAMPDCGACPGTLAPALVEQFSPGASHARVRQRRVSDPRPAKPSSTHPMVAVCVSSRGFWLPR